MAITVKSVTSKAIPGPGGSDFTISVTTPSASVGDLLVIIVSNDYYDISGLSLSSIVPTATATEITSFDSDGGASSKPHIKGWWAPVTTAGAVTVTAATGHDDEEKGLAVYILSGADTTSPVDDSAHTGAMATATNLPAPSVSPTTSDALLICHVQTDGSGKGRTYTAPSGMTDQYNATDGTFMRILGASELLSASGATGTRTWSGSGSAGYTAASVAIKAASGGGSGLQPTPSWVNRTALSGSSINPNGTTSHTCTFTAASAGDLLVAVVAGSVTCSTPTGWTLVQSEVLDASIWVFTKTASASESSFTTTHNGSNYPIEGVVYEFPSTYSIVGTAGGADSLSYTEAGPTCSGISNAVYTRFAARAINMGTGTATAGAAWTVPGVEDYDTYTNGSSTGGIYLTIAYDDGCVSGSFVPYVGITATGSATSSVQAVSFAVKSDATIPTPRFEQGDTFGDSSSGNNIQATYPRQVLAGDLLVVAASYGSTSATATVSDTQGNTYHIVAGPTSSATLGFSDYIFYAVAGATGTNVVTVSLSSSTGFRRLLIHEYQGVDTLDGATGTIGGSGAPDSGSVATTQANELIFGWAISSNGTTSAGSGFTLRQTVLSESTEDKFVTSTGSYHALYPSDGSAWIAQLGAFYYGTVITPPLTGVTLSWIHA